ncbi:hypothetical protein PEPS_45880 (plasmid) [Persicobacter psychrovividus]|uniref:Uncharacterized protein n=1 Tax=Persicobacter psychrovividus TaxID=387638 RepID=A0ABN6LK49_9BACT|nr:hypothetical protein PEPS_45880 [Persicobacter psychrovividus]
MGSLAKSSDGAFQKLKVEVFGGNWHYRALGTRNYLIWVRD